MTRAYAIFDGTNCYWSRHLQGWLFEVSHATWYESASEARRDAVPGGTIIAIVESGNTIHFKSL